MIRKAYPLLVLLLFFPIPSAAGAQEPEEPEKTGPETFYESIDVQVVNLEVFVTDRQGNRITGLTREDFEVLESGKPVEITYFYAVAGETPAAPAPAAATAQRTQPAPSAPAPASPEADEQRLHLAILIDDLSLTPQARNRLLKSLREEVIPRLRPDDLALVGTYEGSTVEIVQGLTADRTALLAALDEVARGAPRGVERSTEKRQLLQQIEGSDLPSGPPGPGSDADVIIAQELYQGIRLYVQRRYDETRATLQALTRFTDALAGLPGRKALLYVGGGLSLRPGQAFFQAWQNKFSRLGEEAGASPLDPFQHDLTRFFDEMVEHANGNRVTFYTLGATEETSGTSAEFGAAFAWTTEIQKTETFNLTESLKRLADGTGGFSAVDAIDPGPILARMRGDFDSYYSLGYVPRSRRDGRNRRIEVRVRNRRDLVVRHRDGRRERTNRDRMADRTLAALLLDPGSNPLEVELELVEETKNDKGQIQLEILVKFPLARLVLLPQGTFHEGKVSVFVSAQDRKGRSSPVQEIAVPIRVPNDQLLTALGQTAAYKMPLVVRPEEHKIAVAVRDELGNVDSAVTASYTPGQRAAQPGR